MFEMPDILTHLYEGVYIVDQNRKIIFWNSGSEKITGYTSEEVVNKHCFANILRHVTTEGKELCYGGCPLHDTLKTGKVNEAEVYLHHKEGHRIPVSVKSIPIYDQEGKISAAVEVFTDLRYQETTYQENRKLKEMLSNDQLTGIPNRRYLEFQLTNLFNEKQEFDTKFGLLFFDIDHFKNVNDTYGHNVGDEILKLVSNTLKSNVRGKDFIGRWGGEEFIAIINIDSTRKLEIIAEKLRILVAKSSFRLSDEVEINVTVSIGGSIVTNSDTIESLVERSDRLMYESKQTGRNRSTIK
jgi:diguanylate cyclase (GGDEF)-like protein/PAS domain S-box-containing protein